MITRIVLLALVALAILGVTSGVRLAKRQAEKPPAPGPLAPPAESVYPYSVAATGIIEAARENVHITTSKPGLVTKVFVNVGDKVKKGDPLFQLDDREALAKVSVIEAQLAVRRAALAADRVAQAEARDQFERVSRDGTSRLLSEDERNRRKFALQAADTRVERSEAELRSAEAQLEQARVEREVLTVRASRDGEVLRVNVREGEYANVNPPEPLMVLGDVETLQVRADVDEQNAPLVERGRPAVAFLKGHADTPLPLTFVRVDPFVVPKKSLTGDSTERVDTRVLQVIFSLRNPPEKPLYVGQQVDVFIERGTPADAERAEQTAAER